MPGGRGRPLRACAMCKWYKYLGNGAERKPASRDRRVLATGGMTTEAEVERRGWILK